MKNVQWGGGILNRKNPKGLQRFDKNKKLKTILIGSIIGIVLIIGGINLYRTFALYKIEKTFNVLEGTIPDFSKADIKLAVVVDGKEDTIPTKESGNYKVSVECDNGATGSWNYSKWVAEVKNFKKGTKCDVSFTTTQEEIKNTNGQFITMSSRAGNDYTSTILFFINLQDNHVNNRLTLSWYNISSDVSNDLFNMGWFRVSMNQSVKPAIWTITALKPIYYSKYDTIEEKGILNIGDTITFSGKSEIAINFSDEDF